MLERHNSLRKCAKAKANNNQNFQTFQNLKNILFSFFRIKFQAGTYQVPDSIFRQQYLKMCFSTFSLNRINHTHHIITIHGMTQYQGKVWNKIHNQIMMNICKM